MGFDAGLFAVETLSAVGASLLAVTGFAWRFGRIFEKTDNRLTSLEKNQAEQGKKLDKTVEETKEAQDQSDKNWRDTERTLGQIEGALGIGTPPAHRPRGKSLPGDR